MERLLTEAKLTVADLSNTFNARNNPDVAGQLRVTRFLQKIEDKDGFVLEDESDPWYVNTVDPKSQHFIQQLQQLALGKSFNFNRREVLVVLDPQYIEVESKDIPDDLKQYVTLGGFTKTSEFGSTNQTTQGSTEDVEDLTAFFCAMRAVSDAPLSEGLLVDKLHELGNEAKVFTSGDTKEELIAKTDDLLSNLNSHNSWLRTYIETANKLFKDRWLIPGMEAHRGSRYVEGIQKAFSKAEGHERYSNINKWTPADIWLVSPGFSTAPVGSLKELNDVLLQALQQRQLVGVSLKALGKGEPHITEFNTDPTKEDVSHRVAAKDIEAEQWLTTGQTSNTQKVGKYKITYRCSKVGSNIATGFMAEVVEQNAMARNGKAGLPAINFELKSVGREKLPKVIDYREQHGDDPNLTGAKISKDLANMFLEQYSTLDTDQKLKVTNGILDYAMSKTSDAAPFIKIS